MHKSQSECTALRLQAKSVSAFLGELASGKLTSPGSVLHETLRWYQLGIHTLQGQVQTLQSEQSPVGPGPNENGRKAHPPKTK